MHPPADDADPRTWRPGRRPWLSRFGPVSRLVHATFGVLMLTCIVTAAILYNETFATLFGDRYVVEQIHIWCGWALPVPLILGFASRSYRADLRRLNRFGPHDRRWLRTRSRRSGAIAVGKFNAGQKLNAALSTGATLVLLLTGTVMYLTNVTPLSWRSGATFVHDWFALGLGLLVVGHIAFALRDGDSLRSAVTGVVPRSWARREHAEWLDEIDEVAEPDSGSGAVSPRSSRS